MADFGQGFVSVSPALRELETTLLNGKIRHASHPVLSMCAANAVTTSDPAGNRKLDKAKARGRMDGMVALARALSLATKSPRRGTRAVSLGLVGAGGGLRKLGCGFTLLLTFRSGLE
jgi:phage terminase large subunit-like protein